LKRKYLLITFYIVICITGWIQNSEALPVITKYQGYLEHPAGSPINGLFRVSFKLYSESTGSYAIWQETHEKVRFHKGVFNVILGEHTPISAKILDNDCYIGVTLENGQEILPRQKLSGAVVLFQSVSLKSVLKSFSEDSKLGDESITTNKIKNGAISESKIADDSITKNKIRNGSVVGSKLKNTSISTNKLKNSAITESKLADQSISTKKIKNDAITGSKLANESISTNKIKNGAIAESKLADQSISTNKIKNGAIAESKLADQSISTNKIKNGAIVESKLADQSISTNKIKNGAIVESKIANGSIIADKLKNGIIVESKLADQSITTNKIKNGTIVESKLEDQSISTSKIKDGAIVESKLADSSVTTDKIRNESISVSKLADHSITADKIQKGVILDNIKSNDGAGSGLDADLFDGINSDAFMLKKDIFNNKEFGFGANNPLAVLHVNGRSQFNNSIDINGGIKPGMVETCDIYNEGIIRYNSKEKLMEFCNGEKWVFIDYKDQSSIAQPDCITNMLQMTFKKIHMGDLNKTFYIQTTETTQEQWSAVLGAKPSSFDCPKNCPVENVSWNDIQIFIDKLNQSEKIWKFRLPTEKEWMFAASSGMIKEVQQSDIINKSIKTNCKKDSLLDQYAWYCANSNNTTHPVAQKKPNAWMLYDMKGNVAEWCSNSHINEYLPSLKKESCKLIKGGSWAYDSKGLDLNARSWLKPDHKDNNIGFRLVMELKK